MDDDFVNLAEIEGDVALSQNLLSVPATKAPSPLDQKPPRFVLPEVGLSSSQDKLQSFKDMADRKAIDVVSGYKAVVKLLTELGNQFFTSPSKQVQNFCVSVQTAADTNIEVLAKVKAHVNVLTTLYKKVFFYQRFFQGAKPEWKIYRAFVCKLGNFFVVLKLRLSPLFISSGSDFRKASIDKLNHALIDVIGLVQDLGDGMFELIGEETKIRIMTCRGVKSWPSKLYKENYAVTLSVYLMCVFVDFTKTQVTFRDFLLSTILNYRDKLSMVPFFELCFGDVANTRVSVVCLSFLRPFYVATNVCDEVFDGRRDVQKVDEFQGSAGQCTPSRVR